MLFTDLKKLVSDNPDNDWEELHSYAKKLGLGGRGCECMSGELPYYNVGYKMYSKQIQADSILVIPKHNLLIYLKHGKKPKMNVVPNYKLLLARNHFKETVRDIEAINGIEYPNVYEKYEGSMSKVSVKWYKDEEEFYLEFSQKHPEGYGYYKNGEVSKDVLIPKFTREWFYSKAVPVPHKQAMSLIYREKNKPLR
jgi:hypothetical protein